MNYWYSHVPGKMLSSELTKTNKTGLLAIRSSHAGGKDKIKQANRIQFGYIKSPI